MSRLHDSYFLPPLRPLCTHVYQCQHIRGDIDSLHCCAERRGTILPSLFPALSRGSTFVEDLAAVIPIAVPGTLHVISSFKWKLSREFTI